MDTRGATTTDATAVLVKRLARPHPSGGMVIERSVILAEGTNSSTILTWIADHDGTPDATLPYTQSKGVHDGLHSPRRTAGAEHQAAPARRYILPARAFN